MDDPKLFGIRSSADNFVIPRDLKFQVKWKDGDKENPRTWPIWYRSYIVAVMSLSTTIVAMYTTIYTSAVDGMQKEFEVPPTIIVLGLTTNLFGIAFGSVLLSSVSEIYGRRPLYLISVFLFGVFILLVALAQNVETILISRFFAGVFAGSIMSNSPGSVTDVTDDRYRALAISCWSLGAMNGSVLGAIIGGFVYQYLGWRWINWLVLICSGVNFLLIALVKETYTPSILRKRTKKIQEETGDQRWWCHYDHKEVVNGSQIIKANLGRPIRMMFFEPICVFWNLYLGVVYAVLFLCFVAYPIVFKELRGWAPGLAGLGYCGIGTGSVIAVILEPLIRRVIAMHSPDPGTGQPAPEAAVFAVGIGSVLIPLGEFAFAWTAQPSTIHWIFPILAGIPFGLGNCLVFIYATNYIAGSYREYATSALAGNTIVRFGLAGLLPLAGSKMYSTLGANWTGTTLALIEVMLIPIPFVFYKYGHRIKKRSRLIEKRSEGSG